MKIVLLTAVLLLACCSLHAQDEVQKPTKLFGGGNVGLLFGSYTIVTLSPQVGYRFNKLVSAGIGLNLLYATQKEQNSFGNDYFRTTKFVTGLNLFGRFYPTSSIFLQAQPEVDYTFGHTTFYRTIDNQPTNQKFKDDTEIIPCFFVGGGYAVPAGHGVFVTTVLYDLVQRPNSLYGNRPVISVGYNIGF